MKLPLTFALALFVLLSSCSESRPPEIVAVADSSSEKAATTELTVTHVDAAGAAQLLASDASVTVLDVRTPQEFAEGHIEGAINVDFKAPTFKDKAAKLDKSKPYLVHCQVGGRSTSSLEVLESLGFNKIHHLDGGMNGWTEAGNSVEK